MHLGGKQCAEIEMYANQTIIPLNQAIQHEVGYTIMSMSEFSCIKNFHNQEYLLILICISMSPSPNSKGAF